MEITAAELWNRILETARPALPARGFQTWLSSSRGVALGEGTLVVEVASPFHEEIIEHRFLPVLEEVALQLTGKRMDISLQAAAQERTTFNPVELVQEIRSAESLESQEETSPPAPAPTTLNRRYTFDRFVVGNHNQLAAAACKAVADKPARMYNPLFLYGGVGLGKTHLMHAIGNFIHDAEPDARITYVSSEQFMNDLVSSIQSGQTPDFRQRYRAMDLLLVDDVHFLEGKERTQEEFFHTFNALYDAQKQIILTSDRPPKDIPGLEARLVSRFEWGLVADIKSPDYETRVAILRKKAQDDGITLDDEVMDYIAHACTASVRELEGAVIKLLAYSSLTNQEVTVDLARAALAEMFRHAPAADPARSLTPQRIRDTTARHWDVRPDALASKRRTKDLTVPRQVAMSLMKKHLDLPLVQIGDFFGGRDHSTVIHSIRKVEEKLKSDPVFRDQVEAVERELL